MIKTRSDKIDVLFIDSSPNLVRTYLPFRERLELLSRIVRGSVITPVAGKNNLSINKIGAFRIHSFLYYYGNSIIKNALYLYKVIKQALYIYYDQKEQYKVVVCTNPFICGLSGLIIGKLTKAKVVIEINGNFESAFKYSSPRPEKSILQRLKARISNIFMRQVINRADMLRLLYQDQIQGIQDGYPKDKTVDFADFVSCKHFSNRPTRDGKYILSMGHPWFLKGMDVLIKAFLRVADMFPDHHLKIVGYCPNDFDYFKNLAGNHPRIIFGKPVHFDQVIELVTGCSLFALASRTEAMGRVLLEAMASRKPVIASRVDGIPNIVKNGVNGLLFTREDDVELSECIKMLLSDRDRYNQISENGYKMVHEFWDENAYLVEFGKMIDRVVR